MKITARYLKKIYDKGVYGLRDASLQIDDGEFAVVLGESGCGKSTLLRLIAGLDKPTAGELYLDGLSAEGIAAKDRRIAMVFQEYVLYPKLTVWENLSVALERYGLSREEEEQAIADALKRFELVDVAGQLPRMLSGGQQQRVALAKAVVTRPKAILFDEPLSNIAEKQRAEYVEYLKELKRQLPRVTFVYVTHNLAEALSLADKLIVIKDGCVLQCDGKNVVLQKPSSIDVLTTLCPDAATDADGYAYNPFAKSMQRFDKSGCLADMCQKLHLNGRYDGVALSFCGIKLNVDDNFRYRFIGNVGEVFVDVNVKNIHAKPSFDDVVLPAERVAPNTYKLCDGTEVTLVLSDFCGSLCFAATDIELTDGNGNRLLAHYRVYTSTCTGRVVGAKLVLPCGNVELAEKHTSRKVQVTFGKGVAAKPNKKGVTVKGCLDEELLGGKKLCYCRLDGFDNYVALWLPTDAPFLTEKTKLAIDATTINIRNI